jgi:hypothetical protein
LPFVAANQPVREFLLRELCCKQPEAALLDQERDDGIDTLAAPQIGEDARAARARHPVS